MKVPSHLVFALGLLAMAGAAAATTRTVTTTDDSGPGSLRQALLDANADASPDPVQVEFNIPGAGVQTITPLSALPYITRPLVIDGYTQPGTSPNTAANADDAVLRIELSGAGLPNPDYGLRVYANDCTVRGLVMNRFLAQILFQNVTNGVAEGNFLGTDATGTNAWANSNGIQILGGASNRVGGVSFAARNIVVGNANVGLNVGDTTELQVLGNFIGLGADGLTVLPNGYGIELAGCTKIQVGGAVDGAGNVISGNNIGCRLNGSASNVVQGNFIGTDGSGRFRRANTYGLQLHEAPINRVGGTGPGEGNLISGNGSGVVIDGVGASNNVVAGNLIGSDVTGTNLLGNTAYGVTIIDSPGNTIGGTIAGTRNVIVGNDYAGVAVSYASATGNWIQGNFIGLDITGTNAPGNGGPGVFLESCSGNLIGGTTAGARNVFASNLHGILINSGSNNVIQGNFIGTDASGRRGLGNSGYGIYVSLNADGTLIGGTAPGSGNLVATNGYDGIQCRSLGAVIQGNFVGTDVTGTNDLFNGGAGILLNDTAHFCLVGGTTPEARNVVTGNGGIGILSSTNIIQGNYVGIGVDGRTLLGVPGSGISIGTGCSGNLVGGDSPGAGNVVAGQFVDGMRVAGSNNVVQGNFVGTDASGTLVRGNRINGLTVYGPNNLIGGLTPGAGNLISGNGTTGLELSGENATGNSVQGNFIGTDVTGTNALPNGNTGLLLTDAPANLIGGTTPAARNIIAANGGYGLGVVFAGASHNVIQGNYIGLGSDGLSPLPNYAGVRILNAAGNLVGGTAPDAGNWIAHQSHHGISLYGDGATNNALLGNHIFANGTLGIDLSEDGVTANDPGDADDNANHLQNFPEISSAALTLGDLTVRYRVDSAPANAAYPLTVEFFHADGGGAGRTLLLRHTYAIPQGFTNMAFTPAATVNEGDPIVATATDANGNTSEFSAVAMVTTNRRPVVQNAIPDQPGLYGTAFSYAFPANTFSDPDPADTLSYTASGLPPGLTFTPATRTVAGTPTSPGTFAVTVAATDNGAPSLSTNDVFEIVVARAALVVSADNKSRLPGQANPTLTGTLVGVTNNDAISATFETPATPASPPGSYPITPVWSDPGNRLPNYAVTTNVGTLTVVDCSLLAINNATLPSATRGAAYGAGFTAANGAPPYSFAVTGGALPGNLALASGGLLSGTPTNTGSFPFTVTATDALGCTVSSNYTLAVVCPAISLSPASLPDGTRGVAYSQSLSGSGGVSPYTFIVTSGFLPANLMLSSAGTLSGTPTAVGSATFTVTTTDAGGCAGSRSYTLNIVCPTLTLAPSTLANAIKDSAYGVTLTTSGGTAPYTYAVTSGTLPGNLSLAPGGLLSGTPTNGGGFTFTVQSTDAGGCTGSRSYTLTVESPVYEGFAYADGVALNGQNGGLGLSNAWSGSSSFVIFPGSFNTAGGPTTGGFLRAGDGTITRRLSEPLGTPGTVRYLSVATRIVNSGPDRFGLLLNGTTGAGLFVGKPAAGVPNFVLENEAGGSRVTGPGITFAGSFGLVVKCEFFAGNDRFTLYVNPVPGQPEPASGTVKFNSDAGTITNIAFTGIASSFGPADFDELHVSSTYAGALPSCPAVTVSPTTLTDGVLGVAYNQTLTASGGAAPYTFTQAGGTLPSGLGLSGSGQIAGTPTAGGSYSFTVLARDANGCTGSRNYTVNVPCPTITVSPGTLPEVILGTPYHQTLTASGGTAPYTFTVAFGGLPGGISLSSSGTFSGTATNYGVAMFGVFATDAAGCSRLTNYTLEVLPNRWVGDGMANQWNLTAANWRRGLFQNGEDVLFDDTGSNNVPVNITTQVSPASVLIDATRTYVFSGSGGIIGTGGLVKANSGELVLAGSNSFAGTTRVSGGDLTVRHANALGTTAGVTVVDGTNASLRLDGNGFTLTEPLSLFTPALQNQVGRVTNGALNNLGNTNFWSGPIILGASTAIKSTAGLLTLNSSTPLSGPGNLAVTGDGDLWIRSPISNNLGSVQAYGNGRLLLTGTNNSGGGIIAYCGATVVASPSGLGLGVIGANCGTVEVSANGSAPVNNGFIVIGGKLRAAGGTVTFATSPQVDSSAGGTFETSGAADQLIFNSAVKGSALGGCCTYLFVQGPGTVVLNAGTSLLNGGFSGYWWVRDGTLQLNHVDAISQRGIVLTGGRIRTGVNAGGRFTDWTMLEGEAAIQPGRSTVGAGVTNSFGQLTLQSGQLTVSPGTNLSSGSTVNLVFDSISLQSNATIRVQNSGGVNVRVASTGSVADPIFSTPSTLTKSGSGTLVLAGAGSYRGGTVVSDGILRVANTNGSGTGTGAVQVLAGATLSGTGILASPVTIRAGGTLAPGDSLGILTISNSLVFKAGSSNAMEASVSPRTNDLIRGLSDLTYGGTLVISKLGAAAYTNGTVFKLFDAAAYHGVFANILPASPGAGLQWDVTSLAVDGRLRVITGANQAPLVANPIPDQNAAYGVPFSLTFAANTFSDPDAGQVLSYTANGMPPGIGFNPATRTFSGMTTSRGVFEVTVIATDNGPSPLSTSDTFNISVPECPTILVNPAGTLPQPTVGSAYTQNLNASGGVAPYSFAVTAGSLPDGLHVSASGILSGNPTVAGNFLFSVTATDAENCTGSADYNLFVRTNGPGTLTLTAARSGHTATPLPNGQVLIAGGYDEFYFPRATAELFDPATGRWIETAPMNTPRVNATATLLPNGRVLVAGGNDQQFLHPVASAELYDPATGAWTPTGSMLSPHLNHTATLLPDRKVLVAGSQDNDYRLMDRAELYDPASGLWTSTGSMNRGRRSHTATLLPNGKVLVTGGENFDDTGGPHLLLGSEIYDPATGAWTSTGPMTEGRYGHAATLLPNGEVMVMGGSGVGGNLATCELFNPALGTWSLTGSLPSARSSQSATLLPNGRVLVAGGYGSSGSLSNLVTYNPVTGLWTASGSLTDARSSHTATLLASGKVLIAGGYGAASPLSSAETYESSVSTWTTTNALNIARSAHSSLLLPNSKVLVVGGDQTVGGGSQPLAGCELYDPATGTWTITGSLPTTREVPSLTLLPNGKVLAAGGYDVNTGAVANAETYDPSSGVWTPGQPLLTPRASHTATLLANGKVLVTGGFNNSGKLSSSEIYDPIAGTWAASGPLNIARAGHTASLLPDGRVLVAAGFGNGAPPDYLASAEVYEPATGTWTPAGSLTVKRNNHTATLLPNGKVLVVGGYNGAYLASAELFDPAAGNWTATGGMSAPRAHHTATLLANGRVLVAAGAVPAGLSAGVTNNAELYDPAAGAWQSTAALATARYGHAATLMPDGRVLVSGGYRSNDLASVELYDTGLGYDSAWQPQISNLNSPLVLGGNLVLTGSRFRGVSGGSSGGTQDSPADSPVVQLRAIESGRILFLHSTNWSTRLCQSVSFTNFPAGWTLVTVFVNGIPSPAGLLRIDAGAAPIAILLVNPTTLPDGSFRFGFTNTPGVPFSVLASTNAAQPTGAWSLLGPVTEVSSGQFQFIDVQAPNFPQRFYQVQSP